MKISIGKPISVFIIVTFLCQITLWAYPQNFSALRPIAKTEKSHEKIFRSIDKIMADGTRDILKEIGNNLLIYATGAPGINDMPFKPYFLDLYMRLFEEAAAAGRGIPAFDKLAGDLSRLRATIKYSGPHHFFELFDIINNDLKEEFFASNRNLFFGAKTAVLPNGALVQNVPILVINRIQKHAPRVMHVLARDVSILPISIEEEIVDYTVELGMRERVATPIFGISVAGATPVLYDPRIVAQDLLENYLVRLYLKERKVLYEDDCTGIPAIDEALRVCLLRQWPDDKDVTKRNASLLMGKMFSKFPGYEGYLDKIFKHEAAHIAMPYPMDERHALLTDLSNPDFLWSFMYTIMLHVSGIHCKGIDTLHIDAEHYVMGNILQRLFQRSEPGSIPGISPRLHRAAARQTMIWHKYPKELFQVISLLPDDVILKEMRSATILVSKQLVTKQRALDKILANTNRCSDHAITQVQIAYNTGFLKDRLDVYGRFLTRQAALGSDLAAIWRDAFYNTHTSFLQLDIQQNRQLLSSI